MLENFVIQIPIGVPSENYCSRGGIIFAIVSKTAIFAYSLKNRIWN